MRYTRVLSAGLQETAFPAVRYSAERKRRSAEAAEQSERQTAVSETKMKKENQIKPKTELKAVIKKLTRERSVKSGE